MSEVKKGTTSRSEYFNLVEKTAGTAKTGVTPGNLYIAYTRSRLSCVASVCTALANSASAWLNVGAIEVDATNAPGLYRVDVPDAAYSNNANVSDVILTLIATVTSSVAPAMKEVNLVDQIANDIFTIVATVGAAVNWAKVTNPTTAVDLSGTTISRAQSITAVTGAVGSVTGNVGGSVGSVVGGVGGTVALVASVTGGVGGSVGSVAGGVTGSVGSVVGNVGGSVGSVVGGVGGTVALVSSVTGNVGGSVGSVVGGVGGAVAGAVGSVVGNVGGSVGSVVGGVGGTVSLVASVSGNVGGSVGSVVGNVGGSVASVLGNVGSVTGGVGGAVGSVTGNVGGSVGSVVGGVGSTVTVGQVTVVSNLDKTGYALSATGSAALTEDYPADGASGTLNQMLYAILQNLGDFSITGTVRTVNKLDGVTAAMQYSLNSSVSPTATTRAL
jgi:hypothetical protein